MILPLHKPYLLLDLTGTKNLRQFCGLKENHPPGSAVQIGLPFFGG
jgi:hypothetical protein